MLTVYTMINLTVGYICSSAIDKSKNLSKIQTKQITYLYADSWQGLDKDFFKKAKALLTHCKKKHEHLSIIFHNNLRQSLRELNL